MKDMSNYSTAIHAGAVVGAGARSNENGFWKRFYARLIAARQEAARREIERYYNGLSNQQLKDLGYPSSVDRR